MTLQTKTIPASQAKNSFGAIISQIHSGKYREVVVENHGEPVAAIIPIKELDALRRLRYKERQKEALAMLRTVRAEVQARLKTKLSKKNVGAIANRFSHELVEDLEKKGTVHFGRIPS